MLKHQGLAEVQKQALLDQLKRSESKNKALLRTTMQRPSMVDVNSVPEVSFLNLYLERLTNDQKLEPNLLSISPRQSRIDGR